MKKWMLFATWVILATFGCRKQTDTFLPVTANDLYPLQVGKTLIYRLDSTLTFNFGTSLVTTSYLAKDSVESSFIDLQGRTSFQIFRYLTDTLANKPWQYDGTFIATIDKNKIEYLDKNNFRFIPLANPIDNNTTWSGNSYLSNDIAPYNFLQGFTYQYQSMDAPFTTLKGVIPHSYTVLQNDEQSAPVFDPNNLFLKTYSKEVYAIGIGLIYKELLHINYQVVNGLSYYVNDNYDITYGLKMNLVDYK